MHGVLGQRYAHDQSRMESGLRTLGPSARYHHRPEATLSFRGHRRSHWSARYCIRYGFFVFNVDVLNEQVGERWRLFIGCIATARKVIALRRWIASAVNLSSCRIRHGTVLAAQ